jgi:hypothetical protein
VSINISFFDRIAILDFKFGNRKHHLKDTEDYLVRMDSNSLKTRIETTNKGSGFSPTAGRAGGAASLIEKETQVSCERLRIQGSEAKALLTFVIL